MCIFRKENLFDHGMFSLLLQYMSKFEKLSRDHFAPISVKLLQEITLCKLFIVKIRNIYSFPEIDIL
jgi:hypothetical protein